MRKAPGQAGRALCVSGGRWLVRLGQSSQHIVSRQAENRVGWRRGSSAPRGVQDELPIESDGPLVIAYGNSLVGAVHAVEVLRR